MGFLVRPLPIKEESGKEILSPLLFVIAVELHQCIINEARARGHLPLPLNLPHTLDFPVIQYAEDTIIILKAHQRELFCLKGLLHTNTQSSGLKINFVKSCLVPINLAVEKTKILAKVFRCIMRFPFPSLI